MHDATAGLPLVPGASGAAVRDLQDRLVSLGHPIDRHEADTFAASTERSVRAFQRQRRLTDDGICGAQTWAALVEAGFRLGDRYLYLRAPMLRGDDVAHLQRRLSALGFDPGRVDGIFGPGTDRALKDLQRNLALTVDGVCGRDVIAALDRLSGTAADGDVASARERMRLLDGPTELAERRFAIGDLGGLDALAHAVCRSLTDRGALAVSLADPDEADQAATANGLLADAYIGLRLCDATAAGVDYFAGPAWSSPGGLQLATVLVGRLGGPLPADEGPRGMSVPILRETRMPAVVCRLAPPAQVVAETAQLATVLTVALAEWVASPVAP